MLQQPTADDFVIGTGETHSIREFVELACAEFGMKIQWSGSGTEEVGVTPSGNMVVKVNPQFYRPAEVDVLIANPSKARSVLGWFPKVSFKELVKRMVCSDCNGVALCGP
jgi:GDPmannose 4,6-dehydratase